MENETNNSEVLLESETDFPDNSESIIPSIDDCETLVECVQTVNMRLETLTYINIFCLVGIALVVGAICSLIFSRYFRS